MIADAFRGDDRGVVTVVARFPDSTPESLQAEASKQLDGQPTFHWPLEFPEVIDRGGFDAFVCNPPFMGGTTISGRLGKPYHRFVTSAISPVTSGGHADLCAYFLIRTSDLLAPKGNVGIITTNTIAQGDTREVGLESVLKQRRTIFRAVPSLQWPGSANLEIALLWLSRGEWNRSRMLSDAKVARINAFLSSEELGEQKPWRLKENRGLACEGSKPMGTGFILSSDEAAALLECSGRNKDVLFPYLNGDDLTSNTDQAASRWIINFFDWPEEQAMKYSACWQIVKERVLPYRQERDQDGNYIRRNPLPQRFWQYGDSRTDFYRRIAKHERILVAAQTSKFITIDFAPNNQVFGQTVIMLAFSDYESFAVLNSDIHYAWIIANCSSLETRQRYIVSDGFDTFPRPPVTVECMERGKRLYELRKSIMKRKTLGLTDLYNLFHDPAKDEPELVGLRALQADMNMVVAAAYEWRELDLGYDFHETKQGVRFTISELARREVARSPAEAQSRALR